MHSLARLAIGVSISISLAPWARGQAPDSLARANAATTELTSPSDLAAPSLAVGTLLNSAEHEGAAPLGITIDEAGTIYVVDLFDGTTHLYDLDLTWIDSFGSPSGTGLHTGIAYDSGRDSLFYVEASTSPAILYETTTDGDILDSFTLSTPQAGGLIADITFDDGSGTFWGIDIVHDEIFEFETDGTLTGASFPSPALVQGYGAYGNSATKVGGTDCFDIPAGDPLESNGVTHIHRVARNGRAAGTASTLSLSEESPALLETFVNGTAWHATGSADAEVNYVVGNATNRIYELGVSLPCATCEFAPIDAFRCTETAGEVELAWANGESYDSIEVLQEDEVIATLGGDAESATVDPLPGIHRFRVRAKLDGEECSSAGCRLFVGGAGAEAGRGAVRAEAGATLFGLAICESNDLLYVPDLFDGVCYRYTKDLELVDVIESPAIAGTDTWTGIAWNPSDDLLYWYDLANATLLITDLDGTLLPADFAFDMASPGGGLIGEMDVNCAGTALVALDIAEDTVYEFDFDGSPTGESFDVPVLGAAFGNAIATRPAGDGYELPIGIVGSTTFLGPDEVIGVDCSGVPADCSSALGPGTFIFDTFVNGLDLTDEGPTGSGGDHRYVLGNALGIIFVEPADCLPCAAPTEVACSYSDDTLSIAWSNEESYDSITIERDGVAVATLDGTADSYSEVPEAHGETVYAVVASCASGGGARARCSIWTVPADVTALVWRGESREGGIASAEAIAEALAAIDRVPFIVDEIAGLDLLPYDTLWVCLGTAPHDRTLADAEADQIVDYLTASLDKGLYIEGGDHWSADAAGLGTSLDGIDATEALEDGAFLCDVEAVTGLDSGVAAGLDLSAAVYAADYDCEGGSIDHLGVTSASGAGAVLRSSGAEAQDLVLFQDGLEASGSAFRSIGSSVEFGGYQGDRTSLMAAYYGALVGEPVAPPVAIPFLRGDASGNGAVSALSDAVYLLRWNFSAGPAPPCMRAADCDGNGSVSVLADALFLLRWQFAQGADPPAPGPDDCGEDPETSLGCDSPLVPPC